MFTKLVSLRWAWNSASNWLIFYEVNPMKPEEIYEVWKFSTVIQVCCPNMIGQFQTVNKIIGASHNDKNT